MHAAHSPAAPLDAGRSAHAVYVLHPGDVALAFEGERLETLLGSCVAVVLTDPRRTVAAMCHIVHSGRPGPGREGDTAYAEEAMQEVFRRLHGVGITPRLCQAHIVGGGNMFPDLFGSHHVGASNVRWVREFLRRHGMEVASDDTGGECYRKLVWKVGDAGPAIQAVAMPGAAP